MTTDTIPEADSAMQYISNTFAVGRKLPSDDIRKLISQACLSYYNRRLAECGGDAKELAVQINKLFKDGYSVYPVVELLQLHTAKAVEELRYSLKETEELSAHHLKERDDLRTRAEKAEAEVAELKGKLCLLETAIKLPKMDD